MIIFHKQKIVYIGIPQTASTFIHYHCSNVDDTFYDDNLLKHAKASEATKQGAKDYEYYFFVRNHVSCFESEFALMNRITSKGLNFVNSLKVNSWKNNVLDFYHKKPNINEFVQSKLPKHGQKFLNYININCKWNALKYEKFDESCKIFFNKVDLPLPDLNKRINNSSDIDHTISFETKQKVTECFYEEMKLFGYL